MATNTVSHPHIVPITAVVVGAVSLIAAIVYAIIPVSTAVTIVSLVLGAVAVILGIIAFTQHSDRGFAVAAIILGAIAILVSVGILAGLFGAVAMGGMSGGGYTY